MPFTSDTVSDAYVASGDPGNSSGGSGGSNAVSGTITDSVGDAAGYTFATHFTQNSDGSWQPLNDSVTSSLTVNGQYSDSGTGFAANIVCILNSDGSWTTIGDPSGPRVASPSVSGALSGTGTNSRSTSRAPAPVFAAAAAGASVLPTMVAGSVLMASPAASANQTLPLPDWFLKMVDGNAALSDGTDQVPLSLWKALGLSEKEFKKYDANGDGFIEPDEMRRWQRQNGAAPEPVKPTPPPKPVDPFAPAPGDRQRNPAPPPEPFPPPQAVNPTAQVEALIEKIKQHNEMVKDEAEKARAKVEIAEKKEEFSYWWELVKTILEGL